MLNKMLGLNKSFWTFHIGESISSIGDYLSYFALSFWILQKTGSAISFATLIIPVAIIQIFLRPLMAPFIEQFDKKNVLIYTKIITAIFVAIDFYLVYFNYYNLILLTLISSICSIFMAIHDCAMAGIIKFQVEEKQISKAVQIKSFLTSSNTIYSPIIAGFIVGTIGIKYSILLNLLTYVVVLTTLSLSKIENTKNDTLVNFSFDNWRNELKSGFHFLFHVSDLWLLFFTLSIYQILTSHLTMSLQVLILKERSLPTTTYSLLESAIGIGSLFGAIFYKNFTKTKAKYFLFSSFLISFLFFTIISKFNNIYLSFLFLNLMYFASTLLIISITSKLAQVLPNNFQAKIFNLFSLFVSGMLPLSLLIVSHSIDKFNASNSLFFIGWICLILGTILFLFPRIYTFLDEDNLQIKKTIEEL